MVHQPTSPKQNGGENSSRISIEGDYENADEETSLVYYETPIKRNPNSTSNLPTQPQEEHTYAVPNKSKTIAQFLRIQRSNPYVD